VPRQRRTAALEAVTAVVSSAARLSSRLPRVWQPARSWQDSAWRFYDEVGEFRYASNWVGQVLSRAELHAAEKTRDGLRKVKSGPAANAMNALFEGSQGQPAMLAALGLHLTVAGECYLVGRSTDLGDLWEVLSVQEVKTDGTTWWVETGDGPRVKLSSDDVVIRIWRPHPRRHLESDSPARASLLVLGEIVALTRHVNAQVTSRLAGAGILVLPQSITFPAVPEAAELPDGATTADQFLAVLGDAMMSPIQDQGSPSAVVPVVIQVPDEVVGKIEKLQFWTELDAAAVELRTEAIRRLALAMDMPPEVVLGTGETTNRWSAWQIEESAIKVHIEPLLELICAALTKSYLRPSLIGQNVDPNKYVVTFDTAHLRLRPNRSREAIELYDRGQLDGEALRRETGFAEDDAPDQDQSRDWLLRKVAGGSTTPEQVEAALAILGVDITGGRNQGETREERPNPSLKDHPDRSFPEANPATPQEALASAAEVMVYRALERAGNRLKAKGHRPANVAAADVYLYGPDGVDVDELLTDAWSYLPRILGDTDSESIMQSLDTYCRHLLTTKAPHDRTTMLRYMS
jgi:hypothetical protein